MVPNEKDRKTFYLSHPLEGPRFFGVGAVVRTTVTVVFRAVYFEVTSRNS